MHSSFDHLLSKDITSLDDGIADLRPSSRASLELSKGSPT